MSNVHDPLFRWAFSDGPRVASLLAVVLPPDLSKIADWRALEKVPVELLDKDFSEKRPDMVWRVPLLGRKAWLYVILEHQSTSLRWMVLRVFDYERCFWEWWTDRHPRARHLPPVVGLVVSHDPRGWTAPTQVWDLRETDLELEALLGAKQPDTGFFLEDLHVRPDQEITAWDLDPVGKLTLLLLKHGRTAPDMLAWVRKWRGLFAATQAAGESALPRFVCYIMSVREDLTAQQLREAFTDTLGNRAGEVVMTEAERLRAEGQEQGVKQGVKRGREEGMAPLVRLFERRLGRELARTERVTLTKRLTALGPDRLGDVVLDLAPQELASWLADPNAK